MTLHRAAMGLSGGLVLLLGGCSTVGNVMTKTGKVLMNPSIPVGAPTDQPTQISLSLHATEAVNPNADSVPDDTAAADAPPQPKGKYAVNLSSNSEEDLTIQMRALLKVMLSDLHGQQDPWSDAQLSILAPASYAAIFPTDEKTHPPYLATPPSVATSTPTPTDILINDSSSGHSLGQYATPLSDAGSPSAQPDPQKIATPITFKVLQLKDDSVLLNSDFGSLSKDLKKALGSTYLADDDYVLKPGQFKFVNFESLKQGTNYVAVIASFHDTDNATWKKIFRVQPKGHSYSLLVTFDDAQVDIQDEN